MSTSAHPSAHLPMSCRTAAALAFLSGLLKVTSALAATIVIGVQSSNGHPMPGTVVTLHAEGRVDRPSAPVHAIMDQVHRAFVPDLLVIPVGSTVEFSNNDTVSHQIYSFSPVKKFKLPLYRGKPYPPVQFDQVGVATLGCNIHDFMLAYVVVTDAPYFGQTNSTGSWSGEVPAGKYRVSIWHPRMGEHGEAEKQITVIEGDPLTLTIRLTQALQPDPLPGHPRSWDAY